MSRPELRHPGYTLEDWKTWEGHWELIHGIAYPTYGMTPAPSLEHQRVSVHLASEILVALIEAKRQSGGGECEVFPAPVDVYLDGDVVQPDLVVVCDPAKKSERGIEGAPDLVVEILSPSTASKDMTRKWWLYEAAGVPEYLIVDPIERLGKLLRLEAGRYTEATRLEWGEVVSLLGGKISVPLGPEP
jgi:Uma2 family endonuclease